MALKRIGVCDTMFSRADMGSIAQNALRTGNQPVEIVRRTVPGVKDLPVACQSLFLDDQCDLVLALGFVGKEPIDKVCGHEASTAIQQVMLATGKTILEVFVHEDEASDRDLGHILRNRVEKHSRNALDLLFDRDALGKKAGTGERQGWHNAKPLDVSAEAIKRPFRVALIAARFNTDITQKMLSSAQETCRAHGIDVAEVVWVPGTFEIALALKKTLHDNSIDGAVCLGAVIKGGTDHDQIVAHNAARLIMDLSVSYGKPVGMGISGPNQNLSQAQERAVSYGIHAVETVYEMLSWMHGQKTPSHAPGHAHSK